MSKATEYTKELEKLQHNEVRDSILRDEEERSVQIRDLRESIEFKIPNLRRLKDELDGLEQKLSQIITKNSEISAFEKDSSMRLIQNSIDELELEVAVTIKRLTLINEKVATSHRSAQDMDRKIEQDSREYDVKFHEMKMKCDQRCELLNIIPSIHSIDAQKPLSLIFNDTGSSRDPVILQREKNVISAKGLAVPLCADTRNTNDLRRFLVKVRRSLR